MDTLALQKLDKDIPILNKNLISKDLRPINSQTDVPYNVAKPDKYSQLDTNTQKLIIEAEYLGASIDHIENLFYIINLQVLINFIEDPFKVYNMSTETKTFGDNESIEFNKLVVDKASSNFDAKKAIQMTKEQAIDEELDEYQKQDELTLQISNSTHELLLYLARKYELIDTAFYNQLSDTLIQLKNTELNNQSLSVLHY